MNNYNKFLECLVQKIDGLHCIVISDRDGVPVVKGCTDKLLDNTMRTAFFSSFGAASHHSSKLGMGENKTVICTYSNYQVVQMAVSSFFVTLVADAKANSGLLLTLEKDLQPLIVELKKDRIRSDNS